MIVKTAILVSGCQNHVRHMVCKTIRQTNLTRKDTKPLRTFLFIVMRMNIIHDVMEKERKLEYYFRMNPNIIYMTKSLGRSDIECEIIVRGITEFKKIVREMQYEFSDLIKDIDTYLVLNQLDTSYYPV